MKTIKLHLKYLIKAIWLLLFLCGFFWSEPIFAQSKTDSLRLLLETETNLQQRVKIFNELAFEQRSADLNNAFLYARKAQEISAQNNYTRDLGVSQSVLGLLYSYTDLLDSALYWNHSAIELLLPTKDSLEISKNYNRLGSNYLFLSQQDKAKEFLDLTLKWANTPKVKSIAYNNLGMYSKKNGDYAKAVYYYLNALKEHEKINEPAGKMGLLSNLGSLYIQKKDYLKAQNCYLEAYEIVKKHKSQENLAQILSGLGFTTNHLGTKKNALKYFNESAVIFKKLGHMSEYAKQIISIADIQSEQKNYKVAEQNYYLAEQVLIEKKDNYALSAVYNNLSECLLNQNKPKEAAIYLEKAYKLSQSYKDLNFNRLIVKNLSSIYETLGQPEKALYYRKIYETFSEQMINVAENVKYAELNHAYETSKKEKKIEQQSVQITQMKKNRTGYNYLLLALFIFIVMIAFFFRKRLKHQQSLEENISSIDKQISSLKFENVALKSKLVQTETELHSLVLKYTEAKEKLPNNLVGLSKREYEVLLFIAEGLSDKEIAEKIFVSVNTVKTHVRRIYDKLMVGSRVEATLMLNRYQLLAEPS
ncbi:MAG: tetratricopeptide repeat protein [bacterium]|nr:tetratricopeptide repeat protein [bacterium]